MSDFIHNLASDPLVAAARGRDEKQFFGQGWSHYPKDFQHDLNGVRYYLSVYNTPHRIHVNWNLRDADSPDDSYADGVWLLFALTPDESRELASSIGLPVSAWLDAACAACAADVTSESVARAGNVIDLPNFHAARAGDDE